MNEEKATVVENEAVKVIDNEETIRESFMPDNKNKENVEVNNKSTKTQKEDRKRKTVIIDIADEDEEEENKYIVEFSRTYAFEGEKISELDLSGLEDVTYNQMNEAESIYKKIAKNQSVVPDSTKEYAIAMAHMLTGLPIEFFKLISGKDLKKVHSVVFNFFYKED